ncbi:isoaspartyl peptidase/L-asparaginase [bacterium]|nr:isoaspartyl peptidase/L-asparaginase [bacterium]NUN46615.1 isoaspartyl peptidase/L-asparaginase [bacterium]
MHLFLLIFLAVTMQTFAQEAKLRYAIAIHGGAGVISKDMPDSVKNKYTAGLTEALQKGVAMLETGQNGLDVVETVVRVLEDNPLFNAGRGSVFTADGTHEMDASIMNGKSLSCGAVAGVKTIKNPISLARLVMEKTSHVFLSGEGAEVFAREMGVDTAGADYFYDAYRYEQWKKAKQKHQIQLDHSADEKKGTVGCVVLDSEGNLYAATSTGGMTNKRKGRIGDSPIIGAGTYASNASCAVSCTGTGEQYIRHTVARDLAARIEYKNETLSQSARYLIHEVLEKGDGGLIAVDKKGHIVLEFNTPGMFRGAADASGRFEVKIWE